MSYFFWVIFLLQQITFYCTAVYQLSEVLNPTKIKIWTIAAYVSELTPVESLFAIIKQRYDQLRLKSILY